MTSLAGQDTPFIIVLSHLMPSQHSLSEMGNMRKLIASLLDMYQKKCSVIGGLQPQH